MTSDAPKLAVCRSDQGDGGWSIHVLGEDPDTWVVSGSSTWHVDRGWLRPNFADWELARQYVREGKRNLDLGDVVLTPDA